MNDATQTRATAYAVANILALMLFFLGVFATLFSLEGPPELGAFSVYFGIPLLVMLVTAVNARTITLRLFLLFVVATLVVLSIGLWLMKAGA